MVSRIALGLAFVLAGFSLAGLLLADDEAAKKADPAAAKQNDDAKAADGKKDDVKKEEADEADPYKLPENASVKELLAFMKSLQDMRTTIKSRQEAIAYQTRGQAALRVAAEKIQQIAKDDDKKLPGYEDAMALYLVMRSASARDGSPAEVKELLAEIKSALAAADAAPEEPPYFVVSRAKYLVAAATQLAITLEYNRHAELKELAPEAYRELGAALATGKDPQAVKTSERMLGAARRLDLPGKPLELKGTEMDGTAFDWEKYRGKVVLVDFWATWCGPCMAELPNVKKNYELYHDRGFEVVGVSMDRDRKALEAFLEKEKTPWVTLSDGDFDSNPVASYYGIFGIPNVILVDKEGKVVSTAARGPELGKLLATLLGPATPADEAKPDSDKPAADKTSSDKPSGDKPGSE